MGAAPTGRETHMYQTTIENWGDSRFLATTRHGSFPMDTKARAPNPGDTLLSGLCGCMGHYVRDYLDGKAIAAPHFTIAAEATATADQSRLAEIKVSIDLGGVRLAASQERELLAAVLRCKLHGTLRQACPISVVVRRQEEVAAAG
jgi:uncharacterized OsmC-like protein